MAMNKYGVPPETLDKKKVLMVPKLCPECKAFPCECDLERQSRKGVAHLEKRKKKEITHGK